MTNALKTTGWRRSVRTANFVDKFFDALNAPWAPYKKAVSNAIRISVSRCGIKTILHIEFHASWENAVDF